MVRNVKPQNNQQQQTLPGAGKKGKWRNRQRKRDLVAYSFLAPNFIGFAVFTLVPMMFAFLLAFAEWDGNNAISFRLFTMSVF